MKREAGQRLKKRNSRLSAAGLLFLWAWALGGAPLLAQEPPDKQVVVNFTGPDGRVYNLVRLTRNFVIYYDRDTIPNAYAILVGNTLEEAWEHFHRQGWRHPGFADNTRVAVYLRTTFGAGEEWAAGFYRLSARNTNPYFDIRWYDLATAGNIDFVKGLCTHEFFHFLQHAYDPRFSSDLRWMWEATAAWSEDERLPAAPVIGSYLRHMPAWYPLWSNGTSMKRYDPSDASVRLMPYGSSIYFKYLSEHHPHGPVAIREIWQEVPGNAGKLSMQILRGFLGLDFDRTFADFSVAVALKTRAPWSLRRGGEIGQEVTPRERSRAWYFKGWDSAGHRIEPATYNMEPYSAATLEFVAPEGQATSSRLRLILRKKTVQGSLQARVIRFTGASMQDLVGVDEIPFAAGERIGEFTVESYGFFTDRTSRVLLVVANPEADVTEFSVAAAVSEPPFLREIQIDRLDKPGLLYHARWDEGADARNLSVVASNTAEFAKDENQLGPLQVQLAFSREIAAAPQMTVGGAAVRFAEPTDERRSWSGTTGAFAVPKPLMEQGFLPVRVTAASPDRLGLDSNPQTIPKLNRDRFAWDGYEPPSGGADQNHKVQVHQEKKEEEPAPPPPPGEEPVPPPPRGRQTASSSTFILIDASGSMGEEGKLESAKAAATAAVRALEGSRDAEVGVGYFTDCGSLSVPAVGFTKDKAAALGAISGLSPNKGTPLVEALRKAGDYLRAHAGSASRSLICLSDGAETCGGGTAALPDYPGFSRGSMYEAGGSVRPPSLDPKGLLPGGSGSPARSAGSGQARSGAGRLSVDPGIWRGYHLEGNDLVETRYSEMPLGGEDAEVALTQRRFRAVPSSGTEHGWTLDPRPGSVETLRFDSREDPDRALALKQRAADWRQSKRMRRSDAMDQLNAAMTKSR